MTTSDIPKIVIKPTRGLRNLNLKEIWLYRELLYFLTWGQLKVRYKQTVIGVLWAIIQPFATMVVFTIIFGKMVKVPSEGFPYPIFLYAGLLPWQFFSQSITSASQSLVNQRNLVQKVYFPRVLLPASDIFSALVDFGISFTILIAMFFFYRVSLTPRVFTLPLFILLAILTALGISLWFSALNAKYRDVGYTVPFLTQLWLFVTPVVYPASVVPAGWGKVIYNLNPMVAVVEGFRWALLGETRMFNPLLWLSVGVSLLILIGGILYFCRAEKEFADLI